MLNIYKYNVTRKDDIPPTLWNADPWVIVPDKLNIPVREILAHNGPPVMAGSSIYHRHAGLLSQFPVGVNPSGWGTPLLPVLAHSFTPEDITTNTLTILLFLHSLFCRAEGLCQQAAIKVRLHKMLNEPIRAKQVNQSSSVTG